MTNQNAILNAPGTIVRPEPVDVAATLRQAKVRADRWLDSESRFYSAIGGFPVTWRKAIRIGIILPSVFFILTGCAAENPMLAASAALSAGWLTYRMKDQSRRETEKGERA